MYPSLRNKQSWSPFQRGYEGAAPEGKKLSLILFFEINIKHLLYLYWGGIVNATDCLWSSEDYFWELGFSSFFVGMGFLFWVGMVVCFRLAGPRASGWFSCLLSHRKSVVMTYVWLARHQGLSALNLLTSPHLPPLPSPPVAPFV